MAKSDRVSYVDAQLYAMLQAIKHRMARDPGWRVVALGKQWLCPYCGEVGVNNYDEHKGPRQILKHLVHECPYWGEDVGTRHSHKQLKAKARRIETANLLRTSRTWRLADSTCRWYCPYCAEATPVFWRPGGHEPMPSPDEVFAHLEQCPANRAGREPYSPELLSIVIQHADRFRQYVVAVRCKMERDPAWRETDDAGHWVCPRCRRTLPEVDMVADPEPMALAPLRIARHLIEDCHPERAGDTPAPAPGAPQEPVPVAQPAAQPVAEVRRNTETQLERAHEIVRKALPVEPPHIEGYDVHFLYRPASDVGGSFYDFFYLSPEDIGIVVGAMPSRGIEAALIMSSVRKSLRFHAQHHRSPAEVLRRTNADVTSELDKHTLVAVLYAALDARGGTLTYARAGHAMPILFNPQDEPPIHHLGGRGLALGLQSGDAFDSTLDEQQHRFRRGDVLVFYNTGLLQAKRTTGEVYGVERLSNALATAGPAATSENIALRLYEDVRNFMAGADQTEDITLVCVRHE